MVIAEQSLRQSIPKHHSELLAFNNPYSKLVMPSEDSPSTPRDWMIPEYEEAKKAVVQGLAWANMRIAINFDD